MRAADVLTAGRFPVDTNLKEYPMIYVQAAASVTMPMAAAGGPLIPVGNVLVVTARPGQESAALGGLLYAFPPQRRLPRPAVPDPR